MTGSVYDDTITGTTTIKTGTDKTTTLHISGYKGDSATITNETTGATTKVSKDPTTGVVTSTNTTAGTTTNIDNTTPGVVTVTKGEQSRSVTTTTTTDD